MRSTAKVLRFPLSGVARDLEYRRAYVQEGEATFASPFAQNVIGECPFASRKRGGSRPGLKAFGANQPEEKTVGRWLWPNGQGILWPNGDRIVMNTIATEVVAPDGSLMYNQHSVFTPSVTKGVAPTECTASAFYRARIVVAKETMWYASRTGDTGDFDYGGLGEDVARAVAGSVANAGTTGETITALMAIGDTALYVATNRRIRVITGEPTAGSTPVSEHVGVISANAWCYTGSNVFFIGSNGLYAMPVGGVPVLASQRLPEDFKGLTAATLVYDPELDGIHVIGTKGNAKSDWFFDIANGAFWPMVYAASIRPEAGATLMVGGVNKVVFRCHDGVWRYWDETMVTDGGSSFTSRVAIGPFRVSDRDDVDGFLAEVSASLAWNSAAVSCAVYTGHTAEEAVTIAQNGQGSPSTATLTADWNNVWRPRKRGAWAVLVLSATNRWGYESITAICKQLGRLR